MRAEGGGSVATRELVEVDACAVVEVEARGAATRRWLYAASLLGIFSFISWPFVCAPRESAIFFSLFVSNPRRQKRQNTQVTRASDFILNEAIGH
jgi:hypothetical protein